MTYWGRETLIPSTSSGQAEPSPRTESFAELQAVPLALPQSPPSLRQAQSSPIKGEEVFSSSRGGYARVSRAGEGGRGKPSLADPPWVPACAGTRGGMTLTQPSPRTGEGKMGEPLAGRKPLRTHLSDPSPPPMTLTQPSPRTESFAELQAVPLALPQSPPSLRQAQDRLNFPPSRGKRFSRARGTVMQRSPGREKGEEGNAAPPIRRGFLPAQEQGRERRGVRGVAWGVRRGVPEGIQFGRCARLRH